jgi:P4 family phage/plasmid primase-like protien
MSMTPDAVPDGRLLFASGVGRNDTRKTSGADYDGIDAREMCDMASSPPSVPKERARWFIPSTYRAADARSHDAQRARGRFWWLILDVDSGDLSLDVIDGGIGSALGPCWRIIHATRSSTPGNRKWRALIPLRNALAGEDYADTALATYDLIETATDRLMVPDRALSRPGQLVFLPNAGEHYEHRIAPGPHLDLAPEHTIIQKRDLRRRQHDAAKRDADAARAERAARCPTPSDGQVSVIEAFNAAHDLDTLLARYGYQRAGDGPDHRSPMQRSGSFATRSHGEHWVSLSASDAAAGIGVETRSGARHGDAFDLFVHFDHRGDFDAAIKAYGNEIRPTARGARAAPSHAGATLPKPSHGTLAAPDGDRIVDTSHDALAIELGRRSWDRDARYLGSRGKWVLWDGTRWQIDEGLQHMTAIRDFLAEQAEALRGAAVRDADRLDAAGGKSARIRTRATALAKELRSRTTIAAVELLARSNPCSAAAASAFDADLMLLGTPRGTVDLRTGALRAALREDMLTKRTSVTPAPGAPDRWLRFLSETFDGDQEVIGLLKRFAGYVLTGRTSEHKMLFLFGTGRNGKSVLLNTMFDIMGDYARRAHVSTFLGGAGEKHPTGLASLVGARMVVGSELPKGGVWDDTVIKDLTGGDVLSARFMNRDFFDFTPQLKLLIAGNSMPRFHGVDAAIRARLVLIRFAVTIPPERRDQQLMETLAAEAPRILQWMIDGALEWQERGLDVPAAVASVSKDYFDDEDVVGGFLADETVEDLQCFVSTADLHARFARWSANQGHAAMTLRGLQKDLAERGVKAGRRSHARGFFGFRLTSLGAVTE